MRRAQFLSDFLEDRLDPSWVFEIRRKDEMSNLLQLLGGMTRDRSDFVPSVCEFLSCGNTSVNSCAKLQRCQ